MTHLIFIYFAIFPLFFGVNIVTKKITWQQKRAKSFQKWWKSNFTQGGLWSTQGSELAEEEV